MKNFCKNVKTRSAPDEKKNDLRELIREMIEETEPSLINECVIGTRTFDGDRVLFKNRDRNYNPTLEVIRDVVNGVEVVYMRDMDTDWSEGMNELGIGIVNSALAVSDDERDKAKAKTGKKSYDGKKIRNALSKKTLRDAVKSVLTFEGDSDPGKSPLRSKSGKPTALNGHTIVSTPKTAVHVESTSNRTPVVKKLSGESFVETNHGDELSEVGYTPDKHPKDYQSSVSREKIAKKILDSAKTPEDALAKLGRKPGDIEGFLNPYRHDYKFFTGSQIMLNLNKLEFTLMIDPDVCTFKGIVDKTPKGHKEKIKITVIERAEKDDEKD
jgi:hypothetical protein